MSIISSYISSRAPVFRINIQASTFMDHILAIVAGLGVRIVIDVVGDENPRLTGPLVGLWEGVVVQHFIKKSPKSFDPFIAYGVRVFVDFLFAESLIRLVLTFLFTGMGIILADIAPRIWADTGLRRLWRHLRRDLYILVRSVPSVPYFDRPRTVRFSPSQAPSIMTSIPPSPSLITVTSQALKLPVPRKRPVPGSFPDNVSETDTDVSVRSPGSDYSTLTGLTRDRRPTVQTESEPSYDPDEGNRSSSVSETSTPTLSEADIPNLPIIEDEDDAREIVLEDHKDEDTPRPLPINLPPTPSDTTYPIRLNAEPREVPPPSANLPDIPDDDEGWENISRREAKAAPLFQDKSTSPPLVEPQSSSSGDQPAAGTSLAAEPQPADLLLDDPRQRETPKLEQPQHTLVDGELATTSSKPTPVVNNEFDFELLTDFNTSTTNPIAQNSGARTPFSAFAIDGSGTSGSIWSPHPVAASSGDIWGGAKDKQGVAGSNAFDVSTNIMTPYKQLDDAQHASAEEAGKKQDSILTPEVDASTPALTTETSTTETPSSQQATTASGPSVTEQKDQDTTSSHPRPEATTSYSAPGMGSASAEPTEMKPANTQQDLDPAGSEVVTEQPSSRNGISTSITAGESSEANTTTATLAAPVIVDEEPFPEKNSDRLDKALELRMEIARIEKVLSKMKRDQTWLIPSSSRGEISVQLEKEQELKSLRAKAERWYNILSVVSESSVDLSESEPQLFMCRAQTAIISCLLKNIKRLVIIVGPTDEKPGKSRKCVLVARLDKLNLADHTYVIGSNEITINLPTSMC